MNDLNYILEKDHIIETIINLFIYTDNKDWTNVKECFTNEVTFDMSSMGGTASRLKAGQITDSWRDGLAPIHAVHHQAGNFKIALKDGEASAFCYGIAIHYINTKSGNNTRTFAGSYDFHLVKQSGRWLIDLFKFNLKFISGNLNLEKENE